MTASIRIEQVTRVNGEPLTDVKHTFGVTMAGPQIEDEFRALHRKDGKAKITTGMQEKIAGPEGTFSSVSLWVEVTLTCDQDAKTIEAATDAAFNAAAAAVDRNLEAGIMLLGHHLDKHGRP